MRPLVAETGSPSSADREDRFKQQLVPVATVVTCTQTRVCHQLLEAQREKEWLARRQSRSPRKDAPSMAAGFFDRDRSSDPERDILFPFGVWTYVEDKQEQEAKKAKKAARDKAAKEAATRRATQTPRGRGSKGAEGVQVVEDDVLERHRQT